MTKAELQEKFSMLNDEQLAVLAKCTSSEELYQKAKEYLGGEVTLTDLEEYINDIHSMAAKNKDALEIMSKVNAALENNPSLQEKLEALGDNSAYEILKPYLENVSEAEFMNACEAVKNLAVEMAPVKALSDDELENVTGGSWKSFWKGFKIGFCDTVKIIGCGVMIGFNVWNKDPNMAEKYIAPLEKNVKHLSDALHNKL